jgi:hypothetical protein
MRESFRSADAFPEPHSKPTCNQQRSGCRFADVRGENAQGS